MLKKDFSQPFFEHLIFCFKYFFSDKIFFSDIFFDAFNIFCHFIEKMRILRQKKPREKNSTIYLILSNKRYMKVSILIIISIIKFSFFMDLGSYIYFYKERKITFFSEISIETPYFVSYFNLYCSLFG